MRFKGTCYRAHEPRWSFSPVSGAGAASQGGRFNPKGSPAFYLSLSAVTALKEISQGFSFKIDPCVLCSYEVDCADLVDLRSEAARKAHDINPAELSCPWHSIVEEGRHPPSWAIARQFIDAGRAGILVRSFAPGTVESDYNLVLWRWGEERPHKVSVFDPSGGLPRNQKSWD